MVHGQPLTGSEKKNHVTQGFHPWSWKPTTGKDEAHVWPKESTSKWPNDGPTHP